MSDFPFLGGIMGQDISFGGSGGIVFKGEINIPADFPVLAAVQNGWFYIIKSNVTDNDPSKTNTGQSFIIGDEIVWNGTNWTEIGSSSVWIDDGANVYTANTPRNVRANKFESQVATGTAPFIVASTTKVASLNVDQVDGYDMDQAVLIASSPTFVGATLSGLPTAGGIVQTDAAGVLSSSVTLPDGTLATTQAPGDNTTKLATTAFVAAAIGGEDNWNRVTGGTNYLIPTVAADEIGATGAKITKGWFTALEAGGLTFSGGKISSTTLIDINQPLKQTITAPGLFQSFIDGTHTFGDYSSNGSPEGVVAAPVSSLCRDGLNGDIYIKKTGATSSGWLQIYAGGGFITAPAGIDSTGGETTTGSQGDWTYKNGYIYDCIATNTWVRHVVATSW